MESFLCTQGGGCSFLYQLYLSMSTKQVPGPLQGGGRAGNYSPHVIRDKKGKHAEGALRGGRGQVQANCPRGGGGGGRTVGRT